MESFKKEQTRTTEDQSLHSPSSESHLKPAPWSKEEENRLVSKLDWHILPVVTILYLANYIEVAGLEKDLNLVGYQYNIGLSLFYITYALSEVCFSTAFIKNFAGFVVVRTLLGICEGGMMPGIAFYLSTYYKRDELVFRIGIFCSASTLSGAFGGLLASGLLKIPKLKGVPNGAWRNIFLIEGAITIALGLAGFCFLPRSAEKSRFLKDREKMIAVQRLVQDEDNGNTAGSQAVQDDSWWRAFKDINTWICGVVASVFAIAVAYGSFRSGRRGIWLLLLAPLVIAGLAILLGTANTQANYAAIFLIAMGAFPQGPMLLSWATNNSAPNTVRAVSSALVVAIGTIGPIITSWIYLPGDSPRYHIANSVQLAGQATFFILVAVLVIHNTLENRRRARGERDYRLNASKEEVARLGSLHPNFRLIV
ncbi:MFS general substrate transporter, putative, partial [Rhizoctonia solani AG-3 Rhs1AP]